MEKNCILPREKIEHYGVSALSDHELLAVILGSGHKNKSVHRLAKELLPVMDQTHLEFKELIKIKGIGKAKASLILSATEFSRRRIRPRGVQVKSIENAFSLVQHYGNRSQEYFICITLNGAHEVIATRVVTIGLANASQVHPREVFADAITDRACAVILAHNHPSGNLRPSHEDLKVTQRLIEAGSLLGIEVLDHIVFTENDFISVFKPD